MTEKDYKIICEVIALAPIHSRDIRLVMLQYMASRLNAEYYNFNFQKFMNYGLKLMGGT